MVRNEEKYEQAVQLRKRGFTLEEIARYCDISKSTASKWLQNKAFSAQVTKQNVKRAGAENAKRLKLINKARGTERVARYREATRSAETEFKHYKTNPLFVAGLMIYLVAGDINTSNRIRLSVNRAESHQIFIKFLHEYIGAEKTSIKFWLLLPQGSSIEKNTRWWSKQIKLSVSAFGKPQFVSSRTKSAHKGTGNTLLNSVLAKQKLLVWVEMLKKEL